MIYSLGINARITMDMHSLNNEGGEGNQIMTRNVTILDEDGKLHTVNGISGDMYKHIQSEHLYYIALENGLSLCEACKKFDANRISGDTSFTFDKKERDGDILDKVIQRCAVDDLEGILITNNNKNIPIKSRVEFGWVVGMPEKTKTENYFHVKLVPDSKKEGREDDGGSNTGQNIFHRPANSGQYAFVANMDCYGIGYNAISRTYAISDNERKARFNALIKSMLYTFIKPTGAMRATQHPHIVNAEGVVTISGSSVPAPVISPLNAKYGEQIGEVVKTLNEMEGKTAVEFRKFNSLSGLTQIMGDILREQPGKVGA